MMRRGGRAIRRPPAWAVAVPCAAVATLVVAAAVQRSPQPTVPRSLPPPVRPAFVPGPPHPLGSTRDLSEWAPVRRVVAARSAPDAAAPAVATIGRSTPEGTDNIVRVLAHRADARGRAWVRVALAILPNGTTGWVPRGALGGYGIVRTRLVIDLERLTATLLRDGRPLLRAPVGVGAPGRPTPRGTFFIRNELTRYRSATYGPVAFGTSARSPTATGWPAGGYVGIHGTDRPDLIPGRISHGCIRLRNADVLALARLMPVGTPVTIR